MNLHSIVSGAVGVINPFETVALSSSVGYTTNRDGSRIPLYATTSAQAQVQALQYKDLAQIDGLNLNGTRRKMYFYGEVDAVVRMLNEGGDTITRGDSSVWLVAFVFEQWPDWCSICATLQDE